MYVKSIPQNIPIQSSIMISSSVQAGLAACNIKTNNYFLTTLRTAFRCRSTVAYTRYGVAVCFFGIWEAEKC